MVAPTRAPARRARTTAPGHRDAPAPRPHLRVVPPNTLSVEGRRRRARRLTIVGSTILVAALFGVVFAHVLLTQRQFRLDHLEQQAANEEAKYERLRLEVAQLESPERVVSAAQQLGMVPPATVKYLSSTRPTPAATAGQADTPPSEGDWATVKSHLAQSRP